jgi:aquaglyceroporin related protein
MANTAETTNHHKSASRSTGPGAEHEEDVEKSLTLQEAAPRAPADGIDNFRADEIRPRSATASKRHTHLRNWVGLNPKAPINKDHDIHPHHDLLWSRIRLVLREPFAEFWGVFVMILFGNGSVAQVLLSTGQVTAPGGDGFGPYQSISWG